MNGQEGIIMIAETFQPAYVQEIANCLARRGYPVLLIGTTEHQRRSYEAGVTVATLRGDLRPGRSFLVKARDLLRYYLLTVMLAVKRTERVVFHVGIGNPLLSGLLLNWGLKLAGKKIVHMVHNLLPHEAATWGNRVLYNLIYRFTTDYLVAHTEEMRKRLIGFGAPAAKITVAGHGTYSLSGAHRVEPGEARRRLGLPPEDFLLLVFGQQRPYKGTHLLLQALGRNGYEKARLLLRGRAHGDYAERLQELIERYALHRLVDCRFGHVEEAEMRLLFQAADAVVLPYYEGSQSGVMFMAFAFGRPVIASDLPGLSGAILPGRTGEVFECGEERALLAAIEKVRLHHGDYDEGFIAAHARDHHSWDACASALSRRVFEPIAGRVSAELLSGRAAP